MQLSTNFELDEFLVSETAARNDIDMTPTEDVIANLRRLARDVLQPLRYALNATVIVTSGYRPFSLNTMIGGSPNSQHIAGEAADIRAVGYGPTAVWKRLERMELPIQQLILEFPPNGWVHVSVPSLGRTPARELMTAVRKDGRTHYLNGLHV